MTSSAKVLQFPLAGISRDTDYRKAYIPSEKTAFTTPFAVNVMGECTFSERQRGGSRPGLKRLTGVVAEGTASFCWPNGGHVQWPNGYNVTADLPTTSYFGPDGAPFVNPHKKYTPRATKGIAPPNVNVGALYRARLFVKSGAEWYASRLGDMTDWDYGGDMEDVSRAAMGNVGMASSKGETITAMMPILDKSLYIATDRALWRLDGEPTNGTVTCVSPYVGCIGSDAWCFDGQTAWFANCRGLYCVNVGEAPKKVSGNIPREFETMTSALLVYEPKTNGIHIFTTSGSGLSATANDWFYDIANGAFWKMEYPSTMRPVAVSHAMVDGVNTLMMLGSDAKWRHFDDSQTTDDGTAFASKVTIGPVRTSNRDDMDGMLAEIDANMAVGSSNVNCSVYTAHSPEQAVALAQAGGATQTFLAGAGWNTVVRTRARGAWVVLVLSSNGRWGYESMTAICKMFGRLR